MCLNKKFLLTLYFTYELTCQRSMSYTTTPGGNNSIRRPIKVTTQRVNTELNCETNRYNSNPEVK